MAIQAHTQITGLLPIELTTLSIRDLNQLYEACGHAEHALRGIMHRPDTDLETPVGDWADKQAEKFVWLREAIRDEFLSRPEPDCETEAGFRRECVIDYALRCGDTAVELHAIIAKLSEKQRQAA